MKLEVGMYIRTKNGNIRKIVELTNTEFVNEPDCYVDKVLINIEQNTAEDTIYMEGWLFIEEIVKASHNIIDLIEVGDYVNGNEIYKISWDSLGLILETTDFFKLREKDIKSVITHEQMEQMAYKIGGNKDE